MTSILLIKSRKEDEENLHLDLDDAILAYGYLLSLTSVQRSPRFIESKKSLIVESKRR